MIGRDRNLTGKDEIKLIKKVDLWIISRSFTSCTSILKDDVPIFKVDFNKGPSLFQLQYRKYYDQISNQRVFEVYEHQDIEKALPDLKNSYRSLGFDVVNYSVIHPPYLLDNGIMYLLELRKSGF